MLLVEVVNCRNEDRADGLKVFGSSRPVVGLQISSHPVAKVRAGLKTPDVILHLPGPTCRVHPRLRTRAPMDTA
jgi:hypothetical protein